MSRKHYIAFATALSARRTEFDTADDFDRAVKLAADVFAADNDRFDRDKFVEAANR